MRYAKRPNLIESVMAETIPMRGRMIHGKRASNELYEEPQDYDIHGRVSQMCHKLSSN
jgi:kynurenine 3-monooxygenase